MINGTKPEKKPPRSVGAPPIYRSGAADRMGLCCWLVDAPDWYARPGKDVPAQTGTV
jgi:hypothetical protein